MSPFHHRDPGPIGAAIDSGAYAELICDGIHIHPSAVRVVFSLFGKKCVLVSDSISAAGINDGICKLSGRDVVVKNGEARLSDGTIAGSAVSLTECIKRAVSFGIAKEKAVYAACVAPLAAIGADTEKAKLDVGCNTYQIIEF